MSKKKNHKKSSGEQAKTLCGVALENRLTEYFALDQFRKSTQGASSAWEGFQRQTAYICSRIASCSDADYYPETVEDLAVVHLDKSLELVQIKSVSDDFSLSKLKPERADSFFNMSRTLSIGNEGPRAVNLALGPIYLGRNSR